jgi:hypothetical protein
LRGEGEGCDKRTVYELLSVLELSAIIPIIIVSEPGSSVSIVSGYGLDDRTIDVRCPTEAKGLFL